MAERTPAGASVPHGSRAKHLRLEVSKTVKEWRESLGLQQPDIAAVFDTSTQNVKRFEDPVDPCLPNLAHLVIAPRDLALPLFRYVAQKHGMHLYAIPALRHPNDALRGAEIMAAAGNTLRAVACFNSGVPVTDSQWGYVRDAARRLVEAGQELEARACSELQQRKLRGK